MAEPSERIEAFLEAGGRAPIIPAPTTERLATDGLAAPKVKR